MTGANFAKLTQKIYPESEKITQRIHPEKDAKFPRKKVGKTAQAIIDAIVADPNINR